MCHAQPSAAETKKLRTELTASENAYKKAKASYAKSPKDAKLKKAYVAATVHFGTTTMNSPLLGPKVKYRAALNLYREALKLDPKNAEALNNKRLIEDIYRQMGREIPK